jgi:hypothetical protein
MGCSFGKICTVCSQGLVFDENSHSGIICFKQFSSLTLHKSCFEENLDSFKDKNTKKDGDSHEYMAVKLRFMSTRNQSKVLKEEESGLLDFSDLENQLEDSQDQLDTYIPDFHYFDSFERRYRVNCGQDFNTQEEILGISKFWDN